MSTPSTIAVIGGGNMASAIVTGCLNAPKPPVPAERWIVVTRSEQRRAQWEPLGVRTRSSVTDLKADWPDITGVLLGIKPQMLHEVSDEARAASLDLSGRMLLSILAGTRLDTLADAFVGSPRPFRAMPNTPLRVGLGLTALCPSAASTPQDADLARAIFSAAGDTIDLDEDLFDAFTALAGSGPAYLFYLAEAMERAAHETGLTGEQARFITRKTLLGAATLFDEANDKPAILRSTVTSRAGTTHAATSHLDEQHVMDAIVSAIVKGRDRGRELANG